MSGITRGCLRPFSSGCSNYTVGPFNSITGLNIVNLSEISVLGGGNPADLDTIETYLLLGASIIWTIPDYFGSSVRFASVRQSNAPYVRDLYSITLTINDSLAFSGPCAPINQDVADSLGILPASSFTTNPDPPYNWACTEYIVWYPSMPL